METHIKLFWSCALHWNYLLCSVVVDGEDGNELELEVLTSSSVLKKSQKKYIMICSSTNDIFFVILQEHFFVLWY